MILVAIYEHTCMYQGDFHVTLICDTTIIF